MAKIDDYQSNECNRSCKLQYSVVVTDSNNNCQLCCELDLAQRFVCLAPKSPY
jgi:hypothetical protein